ncbi:uncharacterized protein LOC125943202 [Dermacentor silvarum]|uniref:uncharacterized protein LOC125943201 n=1 Tax=Dermacentor silvarum TaxID=543639 RepID=UPI002100F317|nr:uncharacterized protein LOC125943201 [Dermacentor silvarum]XP_049517785.1 uncharacterized protein LOC125943202 [Dermacentor silvarum]
MAPTQGHNHLVTKPLAEITFKKHVINKTVQAKIKRERQPNLTKVGQACLAVFRDKIAAHEPELVWNRYTKGKPAPLKNVSSIADTEDLHSPKCLQLFEEFLKNQMPLTAMQREEVRIKTLGQSQNPAWRNERTGRLTASNFRRALHCQKPEGLVKEILYPRNEVLKQGDPRLYGLQNEARAVQEYINLMELYDKNIEVVETGVQVHERYCFIAASPDRLVKEANEIGLLEVKCPASKAGQRVADACQDRAFCAEIIDGEVTLKRDHAYFYQVQGQLGITKKPWCDFVIWTNHTECQHRMSVERIYFNKAIWEDILEGLLYVYKAAVVPELLTRRIRRLGFLYRTGAGYVSYKKYAQGFYVVDKCDEDNLKMKIRRL